MPLLTEVVVNTPYVPYIETIATVRDALMSRLHDGTLDHEEGIRTLTHHLRLGHTIGDASAVAHTYHALSVVETCRGRFHSAETYVQQGLRQAEDADLPTISGLLHLSRAHAYRYQYRPAEAMASYTCALPYLATPEHSEQRLKAEVERGWLYLALGQPTLARVCLETVQGQVGVGSCRGVDLRLGLAEVALAQGHPTVAAALVEPCITLATERGYRLRLARALLVRGHIEDHNGQTETDYGFAARWLLQSMGRPTLIARFLLKEAMYQSQHERPLAAQRMAREAMLIFADHGMEPEARLAKRLC